jgi:hypothetical protein
VTALATFLRVLARLFVDDGSLALAIIAAILLAAGVAALAPGWPIVAGVVLLGGCLAVLSGNVMTAAKGARRRTTKDEAQEGHGRELNNQFNGPSVIADLSFETSDGAIACRSTAAQTGGRCHGPRRGLADSHG